MQSQLFFLVNSFEVLSEFSQGVLGLSLLGHWYFIRSLPCGRDAKVPEDSRKFLFFSCFSHFGASPCLCIAIHLSFIRAIYPRQPLLSGSQFRYILHPYLSHQFCLLQIALGSFEHIFSINNNDAADRRREEVPSEGSKSNEEAQLDLWCRDDPTFSPLATTSFTLASSSVALRRRVSTTSTSARSPAQPTASSSRRTSRRAIRPT